MCSITASRVGREAALCGYPLVSTAMLICTAAALDTDGMPIHVYYADYWCSTTADLHRLRHGGG